jgi:flavin-dependent dehydrogenase
LTGEGIYYAIRSGTLAAKAIVLSKEKGGEASAPYQDSLRALLMEDLKWARHVSQIIYGFTKLSYRTLKQYPELGNLCLRVLAGETSYTSFVVKVKDRMKELVKGRFGEKIRNAVSRSRPA